MRKSLISFDGTKLVYTYNKKSDIVLVFIHGWANNKTVWNVEKEHFSLSGYSTLSLDLRGYGESDWPTQKSSYSFDIFAKDIACILEKEKITRFVLVGHSMGGMISLKCYELFSQKPLALVLCDTTSEPLLENTLFENISPFVKHVVDFLIEHDNVRQEHLSHMGELDFSQLKTSSELTIVLEALAGSSLKGIFSCLDLMLDFDAHKMLKKISCPTLIIEGSNDKLLPLADSTYLANHIKQAELKLVPGASHGINFQDPKDIIKNMEIFFKEHPKLNLDK